MWGRSNLEGEKPLKSECGGTCKMHTEFGQILHVRVVLRKHPQQDAWSCRDLGFRLEKQTLRA